MKERMSRALVPVISRLPSLARLRDAIAQADVGKVCFIVDDQTVAKTNGGNTRSPAGIVDGMACRFGGGNVWVRFDEAPMRIG